MRSKSRSIMWTIGLLALTFLNLTAASYGQTETGQITGTVYDASGAVVPNAKISVKSNTTGLARQTVSGSSGKEN